MNTGIDIVTVINNFKDMPIKSLSKKAVAKMPKKERMVAHIMQSEMKMGKSKKMAEEMAYGHMMKLKNKKK